MSAMTNNADVSSIDVIIKASYDTVSGRAGQKRDWERQRALFFPGARLIPTAPAAGGNEGKLAPQFLDKGKTHLKIPHRVGVMIGELLWKVKRAWE